jgi:hypothetical protein
MRSAERISCVPSFSALLPRHSRDRITCGQQNGDLAPRPSGCAPRLSVTTPSQADPADAQASRQTFATRYFVRQGQLTKYNVEHSVDRGSNQLFRYALSSSARRHAATRLRALSLGAIDDPYASWCNFALALTIAGLQLSSLIKQQLKFWCSALVMRFAPTADFAKKKCELSRSAEHAFE